MDVAVWVIDVHTLCSYTEVEIVSQGAQFVTASKCDSHHHGSLVATHPRVCLISVRKDAKLLVAITQNDLYYDASDAVGTKDVDVVVEEKKES